MGRVEFDQCRWGNLLPGIVFFRRHVQDERSNGRRAIDEGGARPPTRYRAKQTYAYGQHLIELPPVLQLSVSRARSPRVYIMLLYVHTAIGLQLLYSSTHLLHLKLPIYKYQVHTQDGH